MPTHATPVVFLHGLLGSKQDWQQVIDILQISGKILSLAIDLPCHGERSSQGCRDFCDVRQQLHAIFHRLFADQPFWLVGYSLGGRLALDYSLNQPNANLLGTIVEGANIGLKSERERQERWQNDQQWAARFCRESIENVLADWYQQPVFASLTAPQRQQLIAERKHNNGSKIAEMLQATSLAKQEDFWGENWQNIHFLIGEKDQKFRQMAEENRLPYRLIANAGHNAHWENPHAFCEQLIEMIRNENGTTKMP